MRDFVRDVCVHVHVRLGEIDHVGVQKVVCVWLGLVVMCVTVSHAPCRYNEESTAETDRTPLPERPDPAPVQR